MSELKLAQKITKVIENENGEAFLVGGCVRDKLLGLKPKDYDICTNLNPKEVKQLFPTSIGIGEHFGVMLVKEYKEAVEVATYRNDGSYSDGRRPTEVTYATTIEEDAKRRDFTINGIYQHAITGSLHDPYGGVKDIKSKTIRTIGKADDRFQEDALRLMRAIRFATTKNFTIEKTTFEAIQKHAPLINKISKERINTELTKILKSEHRIKGVALLEKSGLLKEIIPELLELKGVEQSLPEHPEGDVWTHTMLLVKQAPKNASIELVLTCLLHDIAKPETQTIREYDNRIQFLKHEDIGAEKAELILKRLKYNNTIVKAVCSATKRHMKYFGALNMKKSTIKKMVNNENFPLELELHRLDILSSNLDLSTYNHILEKQKEYENEPVPKQYLIKGKHLIQLGLKPGPEFKEIINKTQNAELDGKIKTEEEGIQFLQKIVKKCEPQL